MPETEDPFVAIRRARLVDGCRAPGQDQSGGIATCDLVNADRVRDDLRIDVTLADAPSDELRVLRPEVEDEDRTLVYTDPTPCDCCRSLPSLFTAGATTSSDFWNSFTVP